MASIVAWTTKTISDIKQQFPSTHWLTFFELDVGFLRPTQPQNMTLTDDEIIRARLQVDERPLKRLIKKFYAIANCSVEEVDAAYAQLILELDGQDTVNIAKGRSGIVAAAEIGSYEQEMARIDRETATSEQSIVDLKEQLQQAQQSRKNKIVYDSIAKEALKLPSRAHSSENINRLTTELRELQAEQERYAETWSARQTAFSAVVKSLEDLGERIKEEKAEQERREAMDDDVQDDAASANTTIDVMEGDHQTTDLPISVEAISSMAVDSSKLPKLNPSAKVFQPSPLRQTVLDDASTLIHPAQNGVKSDAGDLEKEQDSSAAPADMDVDVEEGPDQVRQPPQSARLQRSRSRSGSPSAREEGEEDEGPTIDPEAL